MKRRRVYYKRVQRRYGEFYEAYEQLVTGNGQLVSSEAIIVTEADETMQELLEKQMNP